MEAQREEVIYLPETSWPEGGTWETQTALVTHSMLDPGSPPLTPGPMPLTSAQS